MLHEIRSAVFLRKAKGNGGDKGVDRRNKREVTRHLINFMLIEIYETCQQF